MHAGAGSNLEASVVTLQQVPLRIDHDLRGQFWLRVFARARALGPVRLWHSVTVCVLLGRGRSSCLCVTVQCDGKPCSDPDICTNSVGHPDSETVFFNWYGVQVGMWYRRCMIAPSFADIFFNNCFKNFMLPIPLPVDQVAFWPPSFFCV